MSGMGINETKRKPEGSETNTGRLRRGGEERGYTKSELTVTVSTRYSITVITLIPRPTRCRVVHQSVVHPAIDRP